MPNTTPHIGIVGGGIGGLSAAISLRRAGAKVTLLEAAKELGEIGAGIHIFPNASRSLLRWGVDEIMGSQLITHKSCTTWIGSELVSRTQSQDLVKAAGFPWWITRRDHLLDGLKLSAEQHGAEVLVGTRVATVDDSGDRVTVRSTDGREFIFDFLVGADGLNSVVRNHIIPGITPAPSSKAAAYRVVLPYDKVFEAVPEARQYLHDSMDMWTGPRGYILSYPIDEGKELNLVTAFCKDEYVTKVEDVDIDEFHGYYKDFHPVIAKVINMAGFTKRWPLLQMPRMKTWSNQRKNVVILGDAAHSMQNHIGQGAGTAVEDAAFLGRVVSEVVRGVITFPEAVRLYEKNRIPRSWTKQQASLISGQMGMDEHRIPERIRSTQPDIKLYDARGASQPPMPPTYRPWPMYCNAYTVPGIFFYDAEGEADFAVCELLQDKSNVDEQSFVADKLEAKWWGHVENNGLRIDSIVEGVERAKI